MFMHINYDFPQAIDSGTQSGKKREKTWEKFQAGLTKTHFFMLMFVYQVLFASQNDPEVLKHVFF